MKKLGKLALIALTLFVLFNVTRCAERCTRRINNAMEARP